MRKEIIDLNEVCINYQHFMQKFDSLLVATVNPDGTPEASYAVYIKEQEKYYIYISELAAHTNNLAKNGQASLLFIEDEDDASHLFARQRVTYKCTADEISRETDHFEHILNSFQNKFGGFVDKLKQMQDFHLYCLYPKKGVYVQGFARAFSIEGASLDQLSHLNDMGHRIAGKEKNNQAEIRLTS